MKTPEEIKEKRAELMKQSEYLHGFLILQYKGSDVTIKVARELKIIDTQIMLLNWVLNEIDDLPF